MGFGVILLIELCQSLMGFDTFPTAQDYPPAEVGRNPRIDAQQPAQGSASATALAARWPVTAAA
ncbi:hypothetical protein, partial [Arthrobacter sp. JCM 19049]|uniref:hypothetical protein n=1 Tax=Arthrobacter sp. JCM 19049 TaxID=1460643 RepID=UPI002436B443